MCVRWLTICDSGANDETQILRRMYVTFKFLTAHAKLFNSGYYALSSSRRPTPTGRSHPIAISFFFLSVDCILIRVLRYVKGAVGETDVPDGLPEFINQRRRWLNGSFFAATFVIAHFGQMMSSGHRLSRETMLFFQTIYNIINLIASWFTI